MSPRVTVLMSVYNGQGFLRQAIQSILNQTFTDFEFLIIEDGSTDATVEIVRSFPDQRIKLCLNGSNIGLISSLNQGLSLATGEYIARMDADDISLSTRLERQVAFMDAHPSVGVCGSWLETFGIPPKSRWCPPADDAQIRCEHLFHSVIYHPTVILRKDFFAKHNLS